MVKYCMIVGCKSHSKRTENASFFRIPKIISNDNKYFKTHELSRKRHVAWVRAIKYGNFTETQLKNGRVCHKHFISGKPTDVHDTNNPDWVPSQNLGYDVGFAVKRKADLDRHNRCVKRSKDKDEDKSINNLNISNEPESNVAAPSCEESEEESFDEGEAVVDTRNDEDENGIAIQTDLTMDALGDVFQKLSISEEVNSNLKEKISHFSLCQESFLGNDQKTKYFTGLHNYKMLFVLHDTIAPHLSQTSLTALSTFQQLILTLMKLRLNLANQYLFYRLCFI